ncbi:MAG: GFA family protein [Oceanobacter sp.]
MHYTGSCHCGDVKFEFDGPEIDHGLRCNCSICVRKGALMSDFLLDGEELKITAALDAMGTYEFASCVAKHHFCLKCGIYPFHQSMRQAGYYRVNLGCLEQIDASVLPHQLIDGKAFPVPGE